MSETRTTETIWALTLTSLQILKKLVSCSHSRIFTSRWTLNLPKTVIQALAKNSAIGQSTSLANSDLRNSASPSSAILERQDAAT